MNHSLSFRLAALVWLIFVALLATMAWFKKPSLDTNVLSLLPAFDTQPLVSQAYSKMGKQYSQQVLMVISGDDVQATRAAVKQVSKTFAELSEVASVHWRASPEAVQKARAGLQPYRYVLLTDELYGQLKEGETANIRRQAYSRLLSPVSMQATDLADDPFYLHASWQLAQTPQFNIHVEDELLRLNTAAIPSYLMVITLGHNAFERETQTAIFKVIDQFKAQYAPQQIVIQTSGLIVHAAAGAQQAQREMSTIGVGSVVGIVLIFGFVFASIRHVAVIFIPVIVGCLVASALLFLLLERVHIITFSFGAGLIGVSIDYVLHYLCERYQRQAVLKRLLPSLILGLASSVAAYSALAITPFPGLRQMALFSVFGLVAAWVTVVLWMPFLTAGLHPQPLRSAQYLNQWLQRMPRFDTHRWLLPLMMALGAISVVMLLFAKANDDLRLLQTSPIDLVKHDKHIQQQLNVNHSSEFLLVPCRKLEGCLQQEERLKPYLHALVERGVLTHYALLSSHLPSVKRQDESARLVAQLYAHELEPLLTQINVQKKFLQLAQMRFERDRYHRLELEAFDSTALASLKHTVVKAPDVGMATMVSLQRSTAGAFEASFSQLKQAFPTLTYVNQVGAISNLLHDYRLQVVQWASLAYLLILLVFSLRYRCAAWRMLAPPLLASILTVAILTQITAGLNLFHMLALILVLGLGIDMSIFLTETQQSAQTWLAVTLSTITSLLAFGLLSLSQTPVLSHFGLTILLGLSFVWILTVLFRPSALD